MRELLPSSLLLKPWGRTGFDGDAEPREAGSGERRLKSSILKLNANNNLAYAA